MTRLTKYRNRRPYDAVGLTEGSWRCVEVLWTVTVWEWTGSTTNAGVP